MNIQIYTITGWNKPVFAYICQTTTKHFDSNVQKGTSPEQLKRYLINSYKVMMCRGIKGCYVYVCNPSLKEYLSQFFI